MRVIINRAALKRAVIAGIALSAFVGTAFLYAKNYCDVIFSGLLKDYHGAEFQVIEPWRFFFAPKAIVSMNRSDFLTFVNKNFFSDFVDADLDDIFSDKKRFSWHSNDLHVSLVCVDLRSRGNSLIFEMAVAHVSE